MKAPLPIIPVILSGGFGTRLWPASRRRQPKHLLPLVEDRTMFRITLERTRALEGVTAPLVACNEDHLPGIQRDLHRSGCENATVILEPVGRNTAPAVGAAALHLAEKHGEAVLVVLPADHLIADEEAFANAIDIAVTHAGQGRLVTFGIVPTHPATGYGYIRAGEPLDHAAWVVAGFVEKPDRRAAEEYVRVGGHFWNSGMFVFTAAAFLEELERHAPEVLSACRGAVAAAVDQGDGVLRLGEESFAASPSISIDYAVMERTDRAAVMPLDAGWSDVGDWAALWELSNKDAGGNVVAGDVMAVEVRRSLLRSTGRLLAVIGLDGVVAVEAPDAVLVAARDRAQEVRDLVERLRGESRPEFESDGTESHTWGAATTVLGDGGLTVRRVTVDPGGEAAFEGDGLTHWIVVRGRARITTGKVVGTLGPGEAALVPAGAPCRVAAVGAEPVELVAVQVAD